MNPRSRCVWPRGHTNIAILVVMERHVLSLDIVHLLRGEVQLPVKRNVFAAYFGISKRAEFLHSHGIYLKFEGVSYTGIPVGGLRLFAVSPHTPSIWTASLNCSVSILNRA